MRAAMEAGVNFFDSHHQYHGGNSEVAIGKALKGWKGQRIYVQTKTPWYREEPKAYFEKLLYEALEKLGVDSIDYFLHHSMRVSVWKKRGRRFIKFTDWALNRGLIKHRGFSSHDTPEHIRQFIDTGEFSCMLVSYNWMNPAVRDVIAHAARRGMGVSVMNPLGGGALATPTPQILRLLPGARSAAEIGMRYVLATPGVATALSGMNTPEQLEENLAVANRKTAMTVKQGQGMRQRLQRIEKASRAFCTACGYCMPCEYGVDIPGNFRLLNQARFFGRTEWAREQYARLKKHPDGDRSAEACTQCGSCEPKCPHDIPIIRQLEEVAAELG
jgi:predicted aldo/keto reductase-like oxidoreductase